MKKIIHTGIAGFGLSGQAFHAPLLDLHEGFRIRKVVERKTDKSKVLYPYVEIVRDFNEILADKQIELVVICTPNTLHYPMVRECLLAGKHVVVEKPFMNTSADADEIIRLAQSKKKNVFVYHNRRWDGDFLTIQKINKSGVLGYIEYYEAHFDRYNPVRKRAAWRDEDLPGSGVLYDLGPHLIDQALVLFGKPDSVEADIQTQRNGSKADDYFRITLNYPKRKIVLTAGMLVSDPGPRYIIHGIKGSFIKYGIDPQEAALRKGKSPEGDGWGQESPEFWGLITIDYDDLNFDGRIETEPGNYMAFYDNVYDVLVIGAEIDVKTEDARDVIRIIELAFESNKSKKIIKLN
ncbi:MAG: oxidoreductase [Bacteroidales bacterium]|nr:oxidoreductase [Bacteroidales bacterium]